MPLLDCSIKLARLALVVTATLNLAACGTMTGTAATDAVPAASTETRAARLVACGAFEPIAWSTRDTDETIKAAKGHNAAYAAVCGD